MEFRTQYNLLCTRYNAYLPAYDLPESIDQTSAADCMISRQAHENDSPTVSTVTLSNPGHGHDATTPTRPHGLKGHLAGLPDYLATLIDIKTAKETPYFFLYANRLGEQGTPSFERYFVDIVDNENTKHPALHLKLHPSITDFVRSLDSLARDSLVGDIHRSLVVNSGATSCHVTPITVIVGQKRLFAQAIDSAHTECSRMRFDWYCDALRVEKNLSVPLAFEYLSTGVQKAWVGCDLFALHAAKASPKILQESYAEWITRHDDITQPHYVFVDDEPR
ncbi:YopJ family acetyltransferase [Robbsia sp. KACC 23696]|uniref:YopJ family acetyltransferase n=1 Tax=Robbsia sp. KACC 23696 TaxID=3149231 RepID=UPI00325B4DC1